MPNIEELISRISRNISEGEVGEILATKLEFDYAYGQTKLHEKTRNSCIFTGEFTGYFRFLKRFYGVVDIPTFSQVRIDKTSENKHPAWFDSIITVSKEDNKKHEAEIREKMKS